MTHNEISRRTVLAGAGVGVAAAAVGATATPAVAAYRHGDRPVSMAMHIHACFSEGGSWADGGGGASMMSQLDVASELGVDVLWWTDHDWRAEAYGYYDGIAFDGTAEDGGLTWIEQNEGTVTGAAHTFVDDPHCPEESGKAMRVAATGTAADWSASYLFGKPGNSFYSTNITDTTLTIDVLGEQIGPDAELVVQVETSYRPVTNGRPAGLYVLEYRLGAADGRGLDSPLVGVVTTTSTGGWQTLTMKPIEDVRAFWPDLIAEDSGLARLRFGVRARNGATGQGVFDHLRIERTRDPLRWPVRTQRELMHRLARHYPGVRQYLSTEVSMIRHMNVFMENFALYPYPDRGKAPVLDNSPEGIEKVVRWYQQRGALVQYNHPPTGAASHAELVATRAFGTELMEIANAEGGYDVIRDRTALYDVAARNGIYLTATSQIDDHVGRNWLNLSHLYLTAVWARSLEIRDLLAALAAGQAWWYHRELWPTGRIDLAVGGRRAMGRVLTTGASSTRVDVAIDNLPLDATVQVVVGACDRTGATDPAIETHTYPASAFAYKPLAYHLPRGHYLRTEVHSADGIILGFGNPFWLLPKGVPVPAARRLT